MLAMSTDRRCEERRGLNLGHPSGDRRQGERRARPPRHVPVSIDLMRQDDGEDLTPRQLAELSKVSVDKVEDWLRWGYIAGTRVPGGPTGLRYTWRIAHREAQRWLRELHLL